MYHLFNYIDPFLFMTLLGWSIVQFRTQGRFVSYYRSVYFTHFLHLSLSLFLFLLSSSNIREEESDEKLIHLAKSKDYMEALLLNTPCRCCWRDLSRNFEDGF